MKKEYQKPEVEVVELVTEVIANDGNAGDGDLESSLW